MPAKQAQYLHRRRARGNRSVLLCQTHGEVFEDTWLENETEPDDSRASSTGNSSTSGENVRRALAEYLYNSN